MPSESWHFLTQAATLLLLGVVVSLAFVVQRRRLRTEQSVEKRWLELVSEFRGLERRLAALESIESSGTRPRSRARAGFSEAPSSSRAGSSSESPLIAVPSLQASESDRVGTINDLKERHATIWTLADSGATAEVIARTIGQPVGQVELVLGLRRKIDGTKTTFSSAPHA